MIKTKEARISFSQYDVIGSIKSSKDKIIRSSFPGVSTHGLCELITAKQCTRCRGGRITHTEPFPTDISWKQRWNRQKSCLRKLKWMLEKKNLIFLFEKCGSAVPAMPISFECGINIDRSAPETHTMWCVTTVILLWRTIRQTSL